MTDSKLGASPVLLLEWWKPVIGFEDCYQVSNVGNVCRVKRYHNTKPFRHFKRWSHWDGRLYVVISGNGKRKTYKIHKMMVDAFLGGTPPGMTVNHKDGVYTQNRLSNFEFLTAKENHCHAQYRGLLAIGSRNSNSKVDAEQVREIRALAGHLSQLNIAEHYGITRNAVYCIIHRLTWDHVL